MEMYAADESVITSVSTLGVLPTLIFPPTQEQYYTFCPDFGFSLTELFPTIQLPSPQPQPHALYTTPPPPTTQLTDIDNNNNTSDDDNSDDNNNTPYTIFYASSEMFTFYLNIQTIISVLKDYREIYRRTKAHSAKKAVEIMVEYFEWMAQKVHESASEYDVRRVRVAVRSKIPDNFRSLFYRIFKPSKHIEQYGRNVFDDVDTVKNLLSECHIHVFYNKH